MGSPKAEAAGFLTIRPDTVQWRDIPGGLGAQVANLIGRQDRPGPYVTWVRFPPYTMDTPHSHTQDRYVTVIRGHWTFGTGPEFDPSTAESFPAGSVMLHPAGAVHWDGSSGDEEAIVQIAGTGPVATIGNDPSVPHWVRVGAKSGE